MATVCFWDDAKRSKAYKGVATVPETSLAVAHGDTQS